MLTVEKVIPVLRIFDEAKAREFYCEWLGFTVDWEHRFEPNTPLYAQISLGDLTLRLSEHYGDGTPGSHVFVHCCGLRAWHAQLRPYKYLRPSIEQPFWGGISVTLIDPFRNQLLLWEEAE